MTKRELLYVKDTGFICGDCGWLFPVPGFTESQEPSADAKAKFERHDCDKYPRKRKEDFSQAAARIVREATKE